LIYNDFFTPFNFFIINREGKYSKIKRAPSPYENHKINTNKMNNKPA
jgi:hypothetical protein